MLNFEKSFLIFNLFHNYCSYPKVIQSIERLSNAGIDEKDILAIDKIISMSGISLYKDKHRYKQNLIDDLQKYGNLKSAIKNLQDKKKINLKAGKKTGHQQLGHKQKKKEQIIES